MTLITYEIILKDNAFKYNHVAVTFNLESVVEDEGEKIFNFKVKSTFDNQSVSTDLALFESDLQQLQQLEFKTGMTDISFLEPDLYFTVIPLEDGEMVLYVHYDSGMLYSNIGTDAGVAVKLNVTQRAFQVFIDELTGLVK
ncbi:hypothetical protein [Staphylococcus intermedius]|uniref:hypothetical protein n=1 Tax=Staphylococcus intermedius TaxID=1285 RepID=UPI000BC4A338|nr:hypothetical protein [Staphylococcus intermedius]PCF86200.1 hypothetical protein B4W76_08100 [Staphylococcus intermedius]